MSKRDYKKDYADLYLPQTNPALIDVPPMTFIMIDGKGDPQGEEYQHAVSVLYALSYTIKIKGKGLAGYFDYVVPPLEGLWWYEGGSFDFNQRDHWRWISMIRQPEFVTSDTLAWAGEVSKKKKPKLDYTKARFENFTEGLCVQAMHIGPYVDESATIEKIKGFIKQNSLTDMSGTDRKHHEIYLSDPNKTQTEKLKTVLRIPVAKSK